MLDGIPDEKRNPASQVWLRRTQVTLENQTLPDFNLDANGCDVESLKRMSESSLALGSIPWRVTLQAALSRGVLVCTGVFDTLRPGAHPGGTTNFI